MNNLDCQSLFTLSVHNRFFNILTNDSSLKSVLPNNSSQAKKEKPDFKLIFIPFNGNPLGSLELFKRGDINKNRPYKFFLRDFRILLTPREKTYFFINANMLQIIDLGSKISYCFLKNKNDKFCKKFALSAILLYLIGFKSFYFRLHSACVTREKFALLFPAKSNSGKTTIVTAFKRKGWHVIHDDICFLFKSDGRIHACNPFTNNLIDTFFFDFNDCNPRFIIYPKISLRKKTEIFPISQDSSFSKIVQNLKHIGQPMKKGPIVLQLVKRHSQILKELVYQCESYQLLLGKDARKNPSVLVKHIEDFLKYKQPIFCK